MPGSALRTVNYFVACQSEDGWQVKKLCHRDLEEARRLMYELGRDGYNAAILMVCKGCEPVVYETSGGFTEMETVVEEGLSFT